MMEKDKEIIKEMRKGKRLNISKIARKLSLPISTVSDRIKSIEKRYVIKHSSLLNYPKLGYLAHAKLAIRINPDKRQEFASFLKKESCVNSVYHVNSGYDFLVEVVFKNQIGMKNWVENAKMRFNLGITSFQILKIEEKEGFMSK